MNFNSFNQQDFSLRPPAEDLGITQFSALVVLVIFHLSHFLLNQSEWKKFYLIRNQSSVLWHPSRALYQLSYSNTVTLTLESFLFNFRISKTMPQTSRQSWLWLSLKPPKWWWSWWNSNSVEITFTIDKLLVRFDFLQSNYTPNKIRIKSRKKS